MPTYNVTAYQWAGFVAYPTSFTITINDDDSQLDWFGGDTGTAQTATFGGSTYTIQGAGLLPANIMDNDGGGAVVSEELLFLALAGYGWVFVPMPGSVFTDGDAIVGWTPPVGWSDTDGVEHDSVICFTAGSRIETPFGYRPVEALDPGDVVLTKDAGPLPITWVGKRRIRSDQLASNWRLRPILVPKGSIAKGVPARDIRVSRQHRILIDRRIAWQLGGDEYLAPAVGLAKAGLAEVDDSCTPVTYIHLMFESHQIIKCENLASESFFPGLNGVSCLDAPTRNELFELFPDLAADQGAYGSLARSDIPAGQVKHMVDSY